VQAAQQAAAQQAAAQAEQARQQAEAAQQRAQEQERAAQAAEQQLQQQQSIAQETRQQLQQEQVARQQAEQHAQVSQEQLQQTQQQLTQAQTDKEQVRLRLLGQLNEVLQTKDSARGLIVNMPDVLFNVNSATLKTAARERLAKVAGILIAYPDIHVEVDGYTDNTGSLDYNEQLSRERADTVRSYLVQQGVPSSSIEAMGFGPNDPIASNDTPQGRQQNRRVNLVVSGQSIGAQLHLPSTSSPR
jgi:outer membrane protein OmpA-like peptidoglycan-associated protein